MKTTTIEIPRSVLVDCGAPIPPQYADIDPIEVEMHYCPALNWAGDDPYFEGTIDGTWKDDFDANKLPREWREKARGER